MSASYINFKVRNLIHIKNAILEKKYLYFNNKLQVGRYLQVLDFPTLGRVVHMFVTAFAYILHHIVITC